VQVYGPVVSRSSVHTDGWSCRANVARMLRTWVFLRVLGHSTLSCGTAGLHSNKQETRSYFAYDRELPIRLIHFSCSFLVVRCAQEPHDDHTADTIFFFPATHVRRSACSLPSRCCIPSMRVCDGRKSLVPKARIFACTPRALCFREEFPSCTPQWRTRHTGILLPRNTS
jgi:hypothetical protein